MNEPKLPSIPKDISLQDFQTMVENFRRASRIKPASGSAITLSDWGLTVALRIGYAWQNAPDKDVQRVCGTELKNMMEPFRKFFKDKHVTLRIWDAVNNPRIDITYQIPQGGQGADMAVASPWSYKSLLIAPEIWPLEAINPYLHKFLAVMTVCHR